VSYAPDRVRRARYPNHPKLADRTIPGVPAIRRHRSALPQHESELAQEGPHLLIRPAARGLAGVRIRGVRTIEGTKLQGVSGRATCHAGAHVRATRHLRWRHPRAAVHTGIGLGERHSEVVTDHGVLSPVRSVVGDGGAGRAITAELLTRIDGDATNVAVCRRAERSLAGCFVGHATAGAPADRKDPILIDAKIVFDLGNDGVGKL